MVFPKYIKQGDTLGVTAPSCGITDELGIKRFLNGKDKLKKMGYDVVMTDNVFKTLANEVSSTGIERAEQFHSLIEDKKVSAIFSAAGGTYLAEMLKYIDYEKVAENPKWIQGYSDNTGLLFSITTKSDVATCYGNNFGDFGMENWEEPVKMNFSILTGKSDMQNSFPMYQGERAEQITGLEGWNYTEPVEWKNGRGEEEINMKGRLLGGCLDVLFFLVGTKYEDTLSYINKYKEDGILWYLESFLANADDFVMNLWHLKEMGWFEHASGFVFGRPLMYESWSGQSYEDIVMYILGDMNVPIIFDADIGHKGPQFTMINGAVATVSCKAGKGTVKYDKF